MGQRQYIVFIERIYHPEGEFVVMKAAVNGIPGHIGQGVVHPSHVPFHVKAQPAQMDGSGHHGPVSGFLGNGDCPGKIVMDLLVEPL